MTVVVDTSTANIASVMAALRRIDLSPKTTTSPEEVLSAERVVLPGVGAFGAGMDRLRRLELSAAIRQRVASERPFLAVCLGMQLLCAESAESPGVAGLSVFEGARVERFERAAIIPQLGWNRVVPEQDGMLREGYAYFANSYRLGEVPAGWRPAYSDHGERFVSAAERGPMLVCQFHPELSSAWGQALLTRWRDAGGAA